MRYLGLDLGSKTLGISMSDTTNTIASVYTTLRISEDNNLDTLDELKKIIKENNITALVLGLPKNMNNTLGPRALITLEYKEKLEQELNIEVILYDERLTSVISNNVLIDADISRKKRKKKVDGMAAVIILQGYLDRRNNEYGK